MIKIPGKQASQELLNSGWIKNSFGGEKGTPTCMHGALHRCSTVPGEEKIVEQVLITRSRGPRWNDYRWVSKEDVCNYLNTCSTIEDDELELCFGPRWLEYVVFMRLIRGDVYIITEKWYNELGEFHQSYFGFLISSMVMLKEVYVYVGFPSTRHLIKVIQERISKV